MASVTGAEGGAEEALLETCRVAARDCSALYTLCDRSVRAFTPLTADTTKSLAAARKNLESAKEQLTHPARPQPLCTPGTNCRYLKACTGDTYCRSPSTT